MFLKQEITEIRFHGRGGQGVVFAATMMAEVAFRAGWHVQAFPHFGAERRGAPVASFLRVSHDPEMPRWRVYNPDYVVAFDSYLPQELVLSGIKEGGSVILNSPPRESLIENFDPGPGKKIYVVDASRIASESGLDVVGIPIVNTVTAGALLKITGLATFESLAEVLKEKIPRNLDNNLKAALKGFEEVQEVLLSGSKQ